MTAPLTFRTARPTLELMLALEDYEAPDVGPDQALPVIVDFLALPQGEGTIDAGFQSEIAAETAEEGQLTLLLGVRYPLPPFNPADPDEQTIYRSVGIRWYIQVPNPTRFECPPVWVADHPDLNQFMEQVRATPEWKEGSRAATWQCDVFGEDD